jgi:hypothetical protein
MIQTSTRLRAAGAGTAVGALVASALLFAPSAQAATEVIVKNSDVLTTETPATYTSWHQGYANNPTGAKVTTKGLELTGGKSQVIKGYADNDATIVPAKPNFNLEDKITGSKFTAIAGAATLQVPLRSSKVNTNPDPAVTNDNFTTLYSLPDAGSRVKKSDLWLSTAAIGTTIDANKAYPLSEIIGALGDYKVIGFGVQAESPAVVTDITWDGVTYKFQEPTPVVTKLTSKIDIYRVQPKSGKITPKNTVKAYATVMIDGKNAPAGTKINGYAKGKKVSTGKVNSKGKVRVTLTKLPKGKSTIKLQLLSKGNVKGSTDTIRVRVVK